MRKQDNLIKPDIYLVSITLALIVVGILLVFDSSYPTAGKDVLFFAKRQLAFAAFGLLCMMAVSNCSLLFFKRITTFLLGLSFLLLVAVLVPGLGHTSNGSTRWFIIGPISFQPSEFAKIAVVLYLSSILVKRRVAKSHSLMELIGPLALIAIMLILIMKEDLGTGLALAGTVLMMLFVAGIAKYQLFGLICAGGAGALAMVLHKSYRVSRFLIWKNPWGDLYGDGYQIAHSLIALGTGGLSGLGLCEGREKMYLPAAHTDYIFATLGEEMGLIGGLLLLGAFLFFTWRGFDIARRAKSTYANFLAVGVTCMITLQAIINVAVVSNFIPSTGVPLPFISYGGSSLVIMMIGVGILLAVSRQVNVVLEERDLYEDSNDWGRNRRAHLSRNKRGTSSSRGRSRRRTSIRR